MIGDMKTNQSLSSEIVWRGLLKDHSFKSVNYLDQPHKIYLGIDGTADSLTIGHLFPLIFLLRLAQYNYQIFLIIGGGTTLIGDPSFKNKERPILPEETIKSNNSKIKAQLKNIFRGYSITILNNFDWLKNVNLLEFLRDFGKFINVNDLLNREFVSQRLSSANETFSYAEFSYSNLQAYDYWYLHNYYQVDLQLGGSDQWSNILSGINLIKRKDSVEVNGLTLPLLINKTTGLKFGKSEKGAIWLDENKTSVFDFYQFFVNLPDDSLEEYFKVLTFLDKPSIDQLLNEHFQHKEQRIGQTKLAEILTNLVHGQEKTKLAQVLTSILTGKKSLAELSLDEQHLLQQSGRTFDQTYSDSVLDYLIEAQLIKSKTEGRQLLQAGAISVNFKAINQDKLDFSQTINHILLIRKGKAYKDSLIIITKN